MDFLKAHYLELLVTPIVAAVLVLAIEYFVVQPLQARVRRGELKIVASLEVFGVIVPADYCQMHGPGETLRLHLRLVNLTSPPRAIHFAESSARIWPRFLYLLGREYSLNKPLIGEDPENVSPTLGIIDQETVTLSGAPIIEYARSRPFRGPLQASVRLVDEAGATYRTRFQIEGEMALRAETMLTWDDYQRVVVD